MKRNLVGFLLVCASTTAFAGAAGGPNCGWGNMLFKGQNGKPAHVLAITTNASTGNNTFGVTSGTNGCSSRGTISYGGKEVIDVSSVMDEFSEDVARGEGEVITTMAVSLGIQAQDRAAFKQAMRDNFETIFPSENVTTEQVLAAMWSVMKKDSTLSKYVS